jgi:D-alanine-D-alanine ligase
MCAKVAIVYNQPERSRYADMGEWAAIAGVLEEVDAVEKALVELGYDCFRVPLSPPLRHASEIISKMRADLVFNLFEGFDGQPGTEATIAEMFDKIGLPYTGCPADAIKICLDKMRVKNILVANDIKTPRYCLLNGTPPASFDLRFPCIVKTRAEHASHGISEESVVHNIKQLESQVSKVSRLFGGEALVEEYEDGREINALVMGKSQVEVFPVSEIIYTLPEGKPRILTYAAKWEPENEYYNCSTHRCPAEIAEEVRQTAVDIVLSVFKLCIGSGYARVDFRQDSQGILKVIDVNPNPDISPAVGAAHQADVYGLSYNQFIERIIRVALEESCGS